MALTRARVLIASALWSMVVLAVQASDPSADALAFFTRYVSLADAFDARITDLYTDNASVRAERRYPHGLERTISISGAEWKAVLRKTLPLARAQRDRSTYRNVRISIEGARARIEATRYSERKCYDDPSYFMVIERQAQGHYLIVEEHFSTQPQAAC